jgi:hypothetical protein
MDLLLPSVYGLVYRGSTTICGPHSKVFIRLFCEIYVLACHACYVQFASAGRQSVLTSLDLRVGIDSWLPWGALLFLVILSTNI